MWLVELRQFVICASNTMTSTSHVWSLKENTRNKRVLIMSIIISIISFITNKNNCKWNRNGKTIVICLVVVLVVIIIIAFSTPNNTTNTTKFISKTNTDFSKNTTLKINKNNATNLLQNNKSKENVTCSKFIKVVNNTATEILIPNCGNLSVCFRQAYANESLVKQNQTVYFIGNNEQITKMMCDDTIICEMKGKLKKDDFEWCDNINVKILPNIREENKLYSNSIINDTNDINHSPCKIVDKNKKVICSCIIISFQEVLAPGLCFCRIGTHTSNVKIKENIFNSNQSQVYDIDSVKLHPKANGTSYNITIVVIKGTFEKSEILGICPPDQRPSSTAYTIVNNFLEPLQFKAQAKLIQDMDTDDGNKFLNLLSSKTVVYFNELGNYGYPGNFLVQMNNISGKPCVRGMLITQQEGHGIYTRFNQEIYDFIYENKT